MARETDTDVLARYLFLNFKSIFISPLKLFVYKFLVIRREKQISYGKNTVDYDQYLELVEKKNRGNKQLVFLPCTMYKFD